MDGKGMWGRPRPSNAAGLMPSPGLMSPGGQSPGVRLSRRFFFFDDFFPRAAFERVLVATGVDLDSDMVVGEVAVKGNRW